MRHKQRLDPICKLQVALPSGVIYRIKLAFFDLDFVTIFVFAFSSDLHGVCIDFELAVECVASKVALPKSLLRQRGSLSQFESVGAETLEYHSDSAIVVMHVRCHHFERLRDQEVLVLTEVYSVLCKTRLYGSFLDVDWIVFFCFSAISDPFDVAAKVSVP